MEIWTPLKNIENVSDGWFCIFTDEDAGEESYIVNEKFYNLTLQ